MGNGSLIQVAKVIKFVAENGIKLPSVRTCPFMKAFPSVHLSYSTVRVKISVVLLGEADKMDKRIEICIHPGIGACLKRIGGTFDDLENVRIIEGVNSAESSGVQSGSYLEILNPS